MHFIWALLLRIDKIANYSLRVNIESTELQKIFCGKKNSCRELLKIKLVKKKSVMRNAAFSKPLQMPMRVAMKCRAAISHKISRRPDHN
jgi:hypothetical protein